MREFILKRETKESKVLVDVGFDEFYTTEAVTPIKFLNHMLELFAFHSGFKLIVEAESLDKDPHHIIEDVAITMGIVIKTALGDKKSINRYGWSIIPMDDALVMCAVDLSGRPYNNFDVDFKNESINDFPVYMFKHFFQSLANHSLSTIHFKKLNGTDDHHIAEAVFKSYAKAMAQAVQFNEIFKNRTPSSKGVL